MKRLPEMFYKMKWWILGCLMIGPVSLQAQAPSGKTAETSSPASGKQVLLAADSGQGSLLAPRSTLAGGPFPRLVRHTTLLSGSSAAQLPLPYASAGHATGGFSSEGWSSGFFRTGSLSADRISRERLFVNLPLFKQSPTNNLLQQAAPAPASSLPPAPAYLMTGHTYYDQHFGFFCKKEWAWQKQTGIPVKVRLGSYDLTQRQEGK